MSRVKARVYHDYYGCDTGCCGHTVEIEEEGGKTRESFDFTHPHKEEASTWARALAEKVIRENWPECLSSIDWESIAIDVEDD